MATNFFINPPMGWQDQLQEQRNEYPNNPVYKAGDEIELNWITNFTFSSCWLYQDSRRTRFSGKNLFGPEKLSITGNNVTHKWTVDPGRLNTKDTNVFYLMVRDPKNRRFFSHYFNITGATIKPFAFPQLPTFPQNSGSAAAPASSATATASNSTAQYAGGQPNNSPSLQLVLGLALGLGLGLCVVLALGYLVGRRSFSRGYKTGPKMPAFAEVQSRQGFETLPDQSSDRREAWQNQPPSSRNSIRITKEVQVQEQNSRIMRDGSVKIMRRDEENRSKLQNWLRSNEGSRSRQDLESGDLSIRPVRE